MYKLAPSILAADFNRLGEQIKAVEAAGADYLHVDVMDGLFVPSISFGMPVIRSIRKETEIPFDVHLMIQDPVRYVKEFAAAGAQILTVHAEACSDLKSTVAEIKKNGMRAGVSINPATPVRVVESILPEADLVLVMSVNPGFGGQKFIQTSLGKLTELRNMRDRLGVHAEIEVDGGITLENVSEIIRAGAEVIVSGSSVFQGDIKKNVTAFKEVFADVSERA